MKELIETISQLIEAISQQHEIDEFVVCKAIHSAISIGLSKDEFMSLSRDRIIELSMAELNWKARLK